MKKWQITTNIKKVLDTEKVPDRVEDFIQTSFFPNNASSDHQGRKHLVDEQFGQQSGPSYSSISPLKIIERKPSQQALGTQNCHTWKDVSQQNKLWLEMQQVKAIETKGSQLAWGT